MRRTPAPGLTAAPPFTTRPIAKPYAGREPHARCCRRVPATARAASPAPAPDPGHPAPGAHNERTLRSGRAAGGRGASPQPATLSLPAMPGTRTLAAFTQMNSPAEISRLPGPAATSPASQAWTTACQAATGAGCPGSGASAANVSRCARRVTPGGWRSARGAEQLHRRLGAGSGGVGTGPGARHQHRPGIPRSGPGPNASTAPQPACSIMPGSSGQPAMIRQGSGTPARCQRPS